MTPLLQADSLCLLRGDRCLFKDLEFALRQGEMLVVEGPNGSGKTSLLRGIAGLLEFEEGAVSWAGRPVRESFHEFRANLAWFSHRVGFKGDLTLLENLTFEAGLRAMDTQRLDAVLAQLGLAKLVSLPFRALSAGQQERGQPHWAAPTDIVKIWLRFFCKKKPGSLSRARSVSILPTGH